jgi:hypothetical protein
MPESKPTSTDGFAIDPSTMNMIAWMLGGGAKAVMGEHQQTWQAGFGQMAQQSAKSKQYGELLKQLLAGGGSIAADGKGTTLKMPGYAGGEATSIHGSTGEGGGGGGGRQSQDNLGLLEMILSDKWGAF